MNKYRKHLEDFNPAIGLRFATLVQPVAGFMFFK